MLTWIALLRGINVGGNNILPMKALASILLQLGLADVRTYIQSGNVVFRSSSEEKRHLANRIATAVEKSHGFRIQILLMSQVEFQQAIEDNPFPAASDDPKTLHFFFLEESPDAPDLAALDDIKLADEEFVLTGRTFYLHAPQGVGRSKLAQRAEKLLGVPVTARNWRTVCKIAAMAQDFDR